MKYIQLTNIVDSDFISKIEARQPREMLSYLLTKYGHEKVDQNEVILELNTHQNDGKVLSKGSSGPISRIFEFYRSSMFVKQNLMVIHKDPSKSQSVKDLKDRIEFLEELLRENEIEFE